MLLQIPPSDQQPTYTIKYGTGNVVTSRLTDDFTFWGSSSDRTEIWSVQYSKLRLQEHLV